MNNKKIIKQFTKELIPEKNRKNRVTTTGIIDTVILSAVNLAFVNESCKSSGKLSKSQVLYRKLENVSKEKVKECFRKNTLKFLKLLRVFSRNRKFIVSFDTTKEAFYGNFSKADEPLYLHSGTIAKESENYYEFLTVAITGNNDQKYILDGIIVKNGENFCKKIIDMVNWIKKELPLETFLFDRGFNSKELIYELNKQKVPYIIFWKKKGNWYKEHFENLKDGEMNFFKRKDKFYRCKKRYDFDIPFILIKQLEYKDKKYDWIFVTNLKLSEAKKYVQRYKRRWGIETIYRVTDDIRSYTTSTKSIIRYFLFMFTCFVYNIWKTFQIPLTKNFTLANFKTNIIIYFAKFGRIFPDHYDDFEKAASILI